MSNDQVQDQTDAQTGPPASVRIAVSVPQYNVPYHEWRDVMIRCEQAGVNALFCPDHLVVPEGDGRTLESLTALAGLAEATKSAHLGPFVLASAYRNPNLLALIARTIDAISGGGRLILGIGSGHLQADFTEYGIPYGTASSRLHHLAAALPIIKNRLAALDPSPVHKVPILIGASGETLALRIVAEHADIWHCMSPRDGDRVESFQRKSAVLNQWCAQVNRQPTEIERAVTLAPTSDGGIQEPDPMREAGATLLVVRLYPPYDLGHVKELLEWRDRVNAS
jgi:probable F420-dependent oxidoreductase